MDGIELINTSRLLVNNRATQETLRRAVSTAYYAMFHTLATSNANILAGQSTASATADWTQIYRSLRHFRAANPLHGWPHLFSPPVQNFAAIIEGMKQRREAADYNPNATFSLTQVSAWIDRAEQAIIDFNAAPAQERAMVAVATLAGR